MATGPDAMVDQETGLVALGAGIALREIITNLLGPSTKYLGGKLGNLTEAQVENLLRIFAKAANKTSTVGSGAVNPRVLRIVIEDGSCCEDEIVAEYYGGLLACSKRDPDNDDTTTFFANLVRMLSAEQIRAHWILYSVLFSKLGKREDINVYEKEGREKAAMLIPWRTFLFLFQYIDDSTLSTHYRMELKEARSLFLGDDDFIRALASFKYNIVARITRGIAEEMDIPFTDDQIDKSGGQDHDMVTFKDFTPAFGPAGLLRRLDVTFWGLLKERMVERLAWGGGIKFEGEIVPDLTDQDWPDKIRSQYNNMTEEDRLENIRLHYRHKQGIVFVPSVLGIDLFLRAQAFGTKHLLAECFDAPIFNFGPEALQRELLKDVTEVVVRQPDADGRAVVSLRSAPESPARDGPPE